MLRRPLLGRLLAGGDEGADKAGGDEAAVIELLHYSCCVRSLLPAVLPRLLHHYVALVRIQCIPWRDQVCYK